ncbi:MAG: hypothetical protein AABY07_08410 [Nanoarchaeota archaeon]
MHIIVIKETINGKKENSPGLKKPILDRITLRDKEFTIEKITEYNTR